MLSKLNDCPNTDTLLCYCNYPFSRVRGKCLPRILVLYNVHRKLDMQLVYMLLLFLCSLIQVHAEDRAISSEPVKVYFESGV